MSLKFAANLTFMFQESKSLLERYELAKAAGFKGVECAFPYDFLAREVVEVKDQAGVEQILINAYPGDWSKGDRGLAALPGRTVEFTESIEKSVDYAKALNCKRIHIMAGVVDEVRPEHLETYESNLKYAAKLLHKNDILGLIEPINQYSLPNYFLSSYEKAMSIIKNVNSPNIKLQLDLFHLQHIAGNLTRNIEDLLPSVGHIQVAQVPDRHEPHTPGEIDYKYIFSLLESLNYQGWIGLEYFPKTTTTEGLKWINNFLYKL